jgi:SAM-dependent methyltransferase
MKDRLPFDINQSINKTIAEHFCPCCFSKGMKIFHELENVPVNSVLNLKTYDQAASFPRGKIILAFCESCGFISNVAFDSTLLEYSAEYESTQIFSSTYTSFARHQAEQLIERHGLRGKDLLEIGCGNGEFLTLLCELGDNCGLGFDPAYKEGRVEGRNGIQVKFIKDFYSEKYAEHLADFIYCRMTLEHIPTAGDFVGMVRRSIRKHPDVLVFFQVPDVTRILRECAFEDIYYEHCSYFSPGSLARLFRNSDFEVLKLEKIYDDQYVTIDARPVNGGFLNMLPEEEDLDRLKSLIEAFTEKFQKKFYEWKERIDNYYTEGRRVVVWGSGSKGVTFLTTLGINNEIEYVVDINPYRQGCYMVGTGHRVIAPDFLKEYKPDVVIAMNAIYRNEINKDLNSMELDPEILALGEDS